MTINLGCLYAATLKLSKEQTKFDAYVCVYVAVLLTKLFPDSQKKKIGKKICCERLVGKLSTICETIKLKYFFDSTCGLLQKQVRGHRKTQQQYNER